MRSLATVKRVLPKGCFFNNTVPTLLVFKINRISNNGNWKDIKQQDELTKIQN